jgi:hypothetical protein
LSLWYESFGQRPFERISDTVYGIHMSAVNSVMSMRDSSEVKTAILVDFVIGLKNHQTPSQITHMSPSDSVNTFPRDAAHFACSFVGLHAAGSGG